MRRPSGALLALCAVACSVTASPRLEGTRWALIAVGAQPADTAHPAYFELRRDGSAVSGSTGCNRLIGHYALGDDSLRFEGLGGTRMFCAGAMEQEQALLTALAGVTRYRSGATPWSCSRATSARRGSSPVPTVAHTRFPGASSSR